MKKSLSLGFAIFALLIAVCASSASGKPADRVSAKELITVSNGNNLSARRHVAEMPKACLKTLPGHSLSEAPMNPGNLSVDGRRSVQKAASEETSALLFESFEGCALFSDATPEGWSQESRGEVEMTKDDHWLGFSRAYAEFNMFTPPAHGDMMMGIFYNDYDYKDEWLITPKVYIPNSAYELSFYWYTLPYYLYVIDRKHIDFDKKVFIDRELLFDVEVMARTESSDWRRIFHIEQLFENLEYGELESLDYDAMQRAKVSLEEFGGETVQFAFRYIGMEGNSFFLDAVRVDLEIPEVSYMPDYSRLFFGFSPDEDLWWVDSSIEFYPVDHPVVWYNTSEDYDKCSFRWEYSTLDDRGELAWLSDETPDNLEVTYKPDYSSPKTLRNNFYYLPTLQGRTAEGAVSDLAGSSSDMLQAGGTTEFPVDNSDEPDYTKYVALQFDIRNEGFGIHCEGDESLGLIAEPIFGRSVNTDAWWENYCFPKGKKNGQYAYVDGFANLFLPHASAPLVVNGVSAAAIGKIYPEAHFTMNIYSMTYEGQVIETPIAQKTISGTEIIAIPGYSTSGDFLVMNFNLDSPVIFDSENTGYGYIVEVCGYHDDNIEYFAPLQSTVPNEFEWCFGFYHIHHSGISDLTNEFSYVAFFKDDYGRDLYTTFAIGLDAHYPWLELVNPENPFTESENDVAFTLHGYYDSEEYTIEAPAGIDVGVTEGRYVTEVSVLRPSDTSIKSVPVKFSAPGVSLSVDVPVSKSGIDGVVADSAFRRSDLYNAQGILIMRNATKEDIQNLPAGLYICSGRKFIVR